MSAFIELYVDQGATYNNTIDLSDDATNLSLNIVGYSVRSQIRRSYYSSNVSETFTCSITDEANGKVVMSLASSNTANMEAGRYVFDLDLIAPTGSVSRVLEGTVTITPGVTR